MQRHWLSVLLFGSMIIASVCGLQAQPDGCYLTVTASPWEDCLCDIDTKWSVGIDVDGDQAPDFRQVRWETFGYCSSLGGFARTQRDQAEALFAVNGVELNMMVRPYKSGAIATLKFGQAILPTPDPNPPDGMYWAWIKPQDSPLLSTLGLGFVKRLAEYSPCPNSACYTYSWEGVLSWTNQVYVGFRMPKGTQWHLGWLRIESLPRILTPDGIWTPIDLVDYAVHPEPDTTIRAGEHPRPALTVLREGDGIRVSWPAVWTGYTLERTRALGTSWTPVPGVTNNVVTLPTNDAPWYFRLRR